MPIVLGNTTIEGLGVGGLPNGVVNADDIANNAITRAKMGYAGAVLQVNHTQYTATFTTTASQTLRIPITNFFVDITPLYSNSKILIFASCAIGWSATPEWSWFVDRTIGGTTTQVGNAGYVGSRMNGYHGGPRDNGASGFVNEVESYSHVVYDTPNTTSSCRYQVCMQDRWSNFEAKHINRTGGDLNLGYQTRGSSSITVMEIAQ